jgi:hypothetical protein
MTPYQTFLQAATPLVRFVGVLWVLCVASVTFCVCGMCHSAMNMCYVWLGAIMHYYMV